MSKRLAAGIAALLLTGMLGASGASAAPKADYTISCDSAGSTDVAWAKAKLDHLDFVWMAADGKTEVAWFPGVPAMPHPPHGSIAIAAGAGAATVQVTFARTDGTSDIRTADCS